MSGDLHIVDEAEFRAAVGCRAGALLDVAGRLTAADSLDLEPVLAILTRPALAVILSEAAQVEELLDAYGALGNERWLVFRKLIAAMKLFARVQYSLAHLGAASPQYRLLAVEGDLPAALAQARRFTGRVLHMASRRLMLAATTLELAPRAADVGEELLPAGRLQQDRPLRHVDDVAETVARIATAFLNLAEEATDLMGSAATSGATDPSAPLPRESELRRVAEDFHNLQALYDTHVAYTDAERNDPELPSMRGQASVVYHLLEVATDLTHYRERHVLHTAEAQDRLFATILPDCIEPEALELVLRECLLAFAARHVRAGRSLSQQLLRRYAEEGEITVPVPPYRGFHVRPSTLVARVTYHYGSPVTMTLDGETYDASSPLELFRANESINAKKRRWLAQEIGGVLDAVREPAGEDLPSKVRDVITRLAEESKVILYEQPLSAVDGQGAEGQTILSSVVSAVSRLQALGKMDIVTPVTATFRGDRRVLGDLQLLASTGYGEDAHGNNIPLPPELGYLRR